MTALGNSTRPRRAVDDTATSLLHTYIADMRAYPLLTREEEAELGRVIEMGREASREAAGGALTPAGRRQLEQRIDDGRRAAHRFVQCNLRLVVSIAKRHQCASITLLDLIQEGNLGLIHAVSRWDHRRGFKFATYARYWIHQAVIRAVAEHRQPVRIPVQVMDAAWRLRRTQARLEAEGGGSPAVDDLARELDLTPKQVTDLLGYLHEPRSLSRPAGREGVGLGEAMVDPLATSPHDEVVANLLPSAVARLLAGLDPREQDVIRLHYGLGGTPPRTLAEIGDRYQVTRERVRQIEACALEKLRSPAKREAKIALGLVTS